MKHKTAWIIALIAIPLFAAVSVLYAQTRDEEKEAWASFINELQNRIDASEFDLQFTITDTDGKPLDGVTMELERSRPDAKLLLSGGKEEKTEKKTVDSKFRIQEKGWTRLELRFLKDGYYLEDRSYGFNLIEMMNSAEASLHAVSNSTGEGEPKLLMKEDIQIKMYKGVPAADLVGTSGTLRYDFEKGQKTVCDLSAFDRKPEKPEKTKKTTVSPEDEEMEDEEEEEEEEYEEERTIGMKSFDLKTKPELTKYIELDFKRDENGEVLFDGMLRDTPCPASFIIRLHSDDPDDGFIAVDKLGTGFVKWVEYEKHYPTAPETGYRKELVCDFGKRGADGRFPYETNYLFAFVKCGQHYGTIFVCPAGHDIGRETLLQVRVRIEQVVLNRKEGDRNVSEGNFYREYMRPEGIIRNIPNKKEAKNEVKTAPDDKVELAKKQIQLLNDALEVYRLDVGTYPSSLRCLEKNIDDDPRWDGPYIVPKVPLDPWENEYRYSVDGNGKAYRLSSSGLSETGTGDPPKRVQQTEPGDRKEPDIFAGLPLWVASRDGKPEVMLRRLVNEAAKRAGAKLQPLGDVKFTPIDADHSYADLDLDIVDEYAGIVRFIREIESYMPHLSWRRLELRVNSARERIAAELQGDASAAAASGKSFRLSARIRAITDTPAAGSAASANGKRMDDAPPAVGDTDFLTLLYDLSVSLPDDALVTDFRLHDGKCDFTIQTHVRYAADLPRHLRFPAWTIARLMRRAVSDDVYSFSATLAKKDNPEPRKETVSPENKIKTTVARNIFDPDSAPRREAGRGRPASNDTRTNNAKDPEAERKEQLRKAIEDQNELKELLKTLSKTPGATKEQTDLVRQRLERAGQEVRRLREQQK
ncbi:MAG: type II secretion system protein GspG [Lentisphaeria bacterium]|nr:type II secretion system protein GspG [Lentisphaeria bacterium]